MGYLLNRVGVEPQPMKIQGILDMDTPKNQRHVREFIGMVNCYKKHVAEMIGNTNTAHQSHRKRNEIRMGRGTRQSIQRNEATNSKSAMLAFPNFDLPFDLYTDASDYQIGACLIQRT